MLQIFIPSHFVTVDLPDDIKMEQLIRRFLLDNYAPETFIQVKDEKGNVLEESELSVIFS